jgi:hypothetical protein
MIISPLPFARSYWVQPGKLMAGFLPGDRDPAVAHAKLAALLDCGVTHIICLMEEDERDHAGRLFLDYRPTLMALGKTRGIDVRWTRHPIPDLSVPAVAEMARTLDTVDAAMRDGCVYVHCWGGRGRTGTVVGCWLARHGADGLARLAVLTAHDREWFPRVPETSEQRKFVRTWRADQ